MNMKELTLIQCTATKRDTASQARNLYDESAYFRAMRDWAKAKGNPWAILSAKHGLVWPEKVIEPYDERCIDKGQAKEIAEYIAEQDFELVHITAGTDYTMYLIPELEMRGIDVVNHFAGEPIGKRIQMLQKAVQG